MRNPVWPEVEEYSPSYEHHIQCQSMSDNREKIVHIHKFLGLFRWSRVSILKYKKIMTEPTCVVFWLH